MSHIVTRQRVTCQTHVHTNANSPEQAPALSRTAADVLTIPIPTNFPSARLEIGRALRIGLFDDGSGMGHSGVQSQELILITHSFLRPIYDSFKI
jgi:hypothetical protein